MGTDGDEVGTWLASRRLKYVLELNFDCAYSVFPR
jgi:hypothetical protein